MADNGIILHTERIAMHNSIPQLRNLTARV